MVTTRPSTKPGTNPKQNETREIIRLTQSRKKIYPNLTLDNFDEYRYRELVNPLEANKENLSKIQRDFLNNMRAVEKVLEGIVLSNFSYADAKSSATGIDAARFSQLERKINMIKAAQTTPIGNPNLEFLFGAQTQTEFNNRMKDQNIIQMAYSSDANFVARAQKVFDFIQKFRKKHSNKLKKKTIHAYLEDIFSGDKDKIETSTIIRASLLSPAQKAKVEKAYDQYHLYRKRLKKQLQLEEIVKKERETFLSKPIEYAKSGEHYVAEKIQTMRDHWAGMDGKEKFIAGLTILVGTAWFLNSENEGMQKARDAMMKAGLIAIGYIGVNTTSKVLFGKSLSRMAGKYIEDKSGKRDFLKESFKGADKEGIDNIQTSLVVLGNHDFLELSDTYLKEEARYEKFHTPDKLRGVSVGGSAEHEMSPHTIYSVMKIVDRKLRKSNSSIAKLHFELKKAKAEAQRRGQAFIAPTWAMIITAILQNQKLGWYLDKKGTMRIKTAKEIETKWEPLDKEKTKHWWPITGRPKDWTSFLVKKTPKEGVNKAQLNKLSSSIVPSNKPLAGVINPTNFGRFTRGFNALYVHGYSKKPTQAVHTFEDTVEKATYITSKIKVDTQTHSSKNAARVASVQSAYQQAIKHLKDTIDKSPNHPLKNVKDRLNEFVHPVFGTFIGPSKNAAKEYVMFLRLVLPGSTEFELRKSREWPEGNMMQEMKEKQLTTGDTLTRADFNVLANRRHIKLLGSTYPQITASAFSGAYESFLAKVRLNKSQTAEIDKILTYYARRFANSGITKAGLIRYLATHKFTDAEIKKALGLNTTATLPRSIDLYEAMKKITLKAPIKDPKTSNRIYIMNSLGNMTVLACYGDKKALLGLKNIDAELARVAKLYANSTGQAATAYLPPLATQYAKVIDEAYNKDTATAKKKREGIKKQTSAYYKI